MLFCIPKNKWADEMKIKDLKIGNVKRIQSFETSFDPHLTVFIGRNGAGKTTILDSISLLLKMTRTIWPKNDGTDVNSPSSIPIGHIRRGNSTAAIYGSVDLEGPDPSMNALTVKVEDAATFQKDRSNWNSIVQKRREYPLSSKDRPLFVYYRQHRGFDHRPNPNSPLEKDAVYEESMNENLSIVGDLSSLER